MALPLKVIISGCHAGPNPSPGPGCARSLRAAFPGARLVAKDHSVLASGLHDAAFDEVWIAPPWEQVDLELHRREILQRLDGGWYLSGLDIETRWLSELNDERLLVPPARALSRATKPGMEASGALGLKRPEWMPLSDQKRKLHSFCRAHDWQVWVKGPAYEARCVHSWLDLEHAAAELGQAWGSEALYLERHVDGRQESVAFAADRGVLLGAVRLEKRVVTDQGKAWGGKIGPPNKQFLSALSEVTSELLWTGGGELELIRDRAGELWLIDWNPRFPAWIHGATLAGVNLPAMLISSASGLLPVALDPQADEFIRIVVEVPVRGGLTLPQAPEAPDSHPHASKHPSGMPQLLKRLASPIEGERRVVAPAMPPNLSADLVVAADAIRETPSRVLLRSTAEKRLASAFELANTAGVTLAYSLKTNPAPEILALIEAAGLLAEVISDDELEWAECHGWTPDRIIYNGPVPLEGSTPLEGQPAAAFADDLEAFEEYARTKVARVVGVRVRPPFTESRFGVELEDPEVFGALVRVLGCTLQGQSLGLSFHVPSSEVGVRRWEELAHSVVEAARAVEDQSGRTFALLDLGGGWAPEDLDFALGGPIARLARQARSELTDLEAVIVEPGKALVEPVQALITRVVNVRERSNGGTEAVLDAGVCDVPLIGMFPHRWAFVSDGRACWLGPGVNRLLGRLCMESDVLAKEITLPGEIKVGDLIAILDAGAYDASTAHRFGRGGVGGSAR